MIEIDLYPEERLSSLTGAVKRLALAALGALLAGFALCAAGAAVRSELLCAAGLIAGAWAAYYIADARLMPARAELIFARHMAKGTARTFSGEWLGLDDAPVYVEGVRARVAACRVEGAKRDFYLKDGDELPPLNAGQPVTVEAVDRFIRRISG